MKNRFTRLLLSSIFIFSISLLLEAQVHDSYTGNWKFEAPDAPEGSTTGNIVIKINTIVMTFDDMQEYPSSWIKFRNDSLIYETAFDLATVVFSLKIVNKSTMTGKAVWEGGESEVTLTKRIMGVKI